MILKRYSGVIYSYLVRYLERMYFIFILINTDN